MEGVKITRRNDTTKRPAASGSPAAGSGELDPQRGNREEPAQPGKFLDTAENRAADLAIGGVVSGIMRSHLRTILALTLLGSILAACSPSPERDSKQAPPAEASVPAEDESAIFEEDFEAGDAQEWVEDATTEAPSDDDPEPDSKKE